MLAFMGLLLFSIDDDLDTDLDTPVWDGALHDVMRYEALAREVEHLVARRNDDTADGPAEGGTSRFGRVPPSVGSLVGLATALRRLAASAASGTYRELFAQGGIVGGFIEMSYASARDVAAGVAPSLDGALAAQKRLDAVADELPDELRAPVLEAFVAFARFRDDVV
jgi:hypothetical protein